MTAESGDRFHRRTDGTSNRKIYGGYVTAKLFLRLATAIMMFLCFALLGRAQTSSATISGHIVDQSNGIVPNAEVRLVNQQTGVRVTTRVRSDGDFIFPDVQPGTFAVIVEAPGYKELRKINLTLSASQNLSAGTLILEIGAVSETVTVSTSVCRRTMSATHLRP